MTRILSLDDNPDMLLLLSLILERYGYEHLFSMDSYEAWAILHTEPIDLFILDLMLPDIDPWEFIAMMKVDNILSCVPLIVLTARSTIMDEGFSGYKQVDAFITKPFFVSDFLTTVKDILQKYGKPLPTSEEVIYITTLRKQPIEKRIAALQNSDPSVRRQAVWALATRQEPKQDAIQALISALNDEDQWVRLSAVRALGYSEDRQALEPLKKLSEKVPREQIKRQRAVKPPQVVQWDAEVSVARWARGAIERIEAAHK